MKVVIVESPSKAKTINKYLGSDYKVLASFGHIRDLPSKSGSVDPQADFSMTWAISDNSERHLKEIIKALKGATHLYLATDPDREGEAISWHVREVLKEKKALRQVEVKRVVFYEITKKAILAAMKAPRDLDDNLIEAYLARRALDYLVGFTLSPLLWTKLPGSKSAGRVQSVALRLVNDREGEIEVFKPQEYWTIAADFHTPTSQPLHTRLHTFENKKVEKFSFTSETMAEEAQHILEKKEYAVSRLDSKEVKRHPSAPFITSTLQQEASRKLRYGAKRTMQIAQRLYEGIDVNGESIGLITYMRTDSVIVSQEAIESARDVIKNMYGQNYVPSAPRVYKTKAKNAQEAHEAIRPTDMSRTPDQLKHVLETDQWALYDLIWKRTLASQMESALFNQITLDATSHDHTAIFRATGSTLVFDGFLKVYEEGRDEENDDKTTLLPKVQTKDALNLQKVTKDQHFTQPPPRYTEASLVKNLEELGIGRPSTYATIMGTLLERKYVKLDKRALIPESLGRLVTTFLVEYFPKFIEYDFTASMEQHLDEVSHGQENWKALLKSFWDPFYEAVGVAKNLRISDVLTMLDQALATYLYDNGNDEGRQCPKCTTGQLHLKLSKFGGFLGCNQYPTCDYTRKFHTNDDTNDDTTEFLEPRVLGHDPRTDETMTVRRGPYGFYIQWGDGTKTEKPRRVALPKATNPLTLSLEEALEITALPKVLGQDPETQETISVAIGRFGPYVKCGKLFASIPKTEDPLAVNLERAFELMAIAKEKAATKSEKIGFSKGTSSSRKSQTANKAPVTKKVSSTKKGLPKTKAVKKESKKP